MKIFSVVGARQIPRLARDKFYEGSDNTQTVESFE